MIGLDDMRAAAVQVAALTDGQHGADRLAALLDLRGIDAAALRVTTMSLHAWRPADDQRAHAASTALGVLVGLALAGRLEAPPAEGGP